MIISETKSRQENKNVMEQNNPTDRSLLSQVVNRDVATCGATGVAGKHINPIILKET